MFDAVNFFVRCHYSVNEATMITSLTFPNNMFHFIFSNTSVYFPFGETKHLPGYKSYWWFNVTEIGGYKVRAVDLDSSQSVSNVRLRRSSMMASTSTELYQDVPPSLVELQQPTWVDILHCSYTCYTNHQRVGITETDIHPPIFYDFPSIYKVKHPLQNI